MCVQFLYCREINYLTHDQHGYIRNQHKKWATVNLREAEHYEQWTRLIPCQSYSPTQHLHVHFKHDLSIGNTIFNVSKHLSQKKKKKRAIYMMVQCIHREWFQQNGPFIWVLLIKITVLCSETCQNDWRQYLKCSLITSIKHFIENTCGMIF